MSEILLIVLLVLVAGILVLEFALWRRPSPIPVDLSDIHSGIDRLHQSLRQTEQGTRDEFSRLRQELAGQNQAFKLEVAGSLKLLNDLLFQQLSTSRSATGAQLDQFRIGTEQRLDNFSVETNQKIDLLRKGVADSGSQLQNQVGQELERLRSGLGQAAQQSREEIAAGLKAVSESLASSASQLISAQKIQMDEIRMTVEGRLNALNADNEKRLEQMRQTVDEKLQGTLEARLGESFKQVSERLEQVHKGLGEMQTLASGVGDLKRVLTNVKTRGTWGEVQLGSLLEQILAPEQFDKNVNTTGTQERVEFAIKLPGHEKGETCWLPVDAKFPVEDYHRVVEASESGDPEAVEAACRALESTIRLCAKTISEKYLSPPRTTDFGILFLATEGLYAEALRRVGLAETLQREYKVIITGPNTFAAILNSLQMGFKTLVIQQRSSEVWETLGSVKTQFAKYAGVLAKVKKKLQEATNTVDVAERRTRVLQGELRHVESGRGDAFGQLTGLLEFESDESEALAGAAVTTGTEATDE
jgi:DNA recombination protein RmuC